MDLAHLELQGSALPCPQEALTPAKLGISSKAPAQMRLGIRPAKEDEVVRGGSSRKGQSLGQIVGYGARAGLPILQKEGGGGDQKSEDDGGRKSTTGEHVARI